MQAQRDFILTIDRAAGLAVDAAGAAKAARQPAVPDRQTVLVNSAIVRLEKALEDLFAARQEPWHPPLQKHPQQLELT